MPLMFMMAKFGTRKHMVALLDEGEVYYSPVRTFAKMYEPGVRRDGWEGATRIWQKRHLTSFTIDKREFLPQLRGPLVQFIPQLAKFKGTHVFCLCHVTAEQIEAGERKITSPRMSEFGDHAVIIRDTAEFNRRLTKAIKLPLREALSHGPIEYMPAHYSGEYHLFKKPVEYSWQREYRYTMRAPFETSKTIPVYVGSLRDIAHLVPLDRYQNHIDVNAEGVAEFHVS